MRRLDQQFLSRLLMIFVLILGVIALSATLSQAARLTENILERGLTLGQFALILLTIVPKMAELVTPLAFGIAVVLACVHRNESGTTLLLRAAGRSALVDGVAVTVIAAMTAAGLLLLSGAVIPQSQGAYRTLNAQMQQDSLAAITLPIGSPIAVGAGVMLTVGAHTADGLFHDIEVVDYSARDETTIITATRATLSPAPDGAAILTLENGRLQRIDPTGRQTLLNFTSTALAVDLPTRRTPKSNQHPVDTRSSLDLLADRTDAAAAEELTRRLAAALSLVSFSVLAAGLLFGRRPAVGGQALLAVILIAVLVVFLLLQSAVISGSGFSDHTLWFVLTLSIAPLALLPFIRLGRRLAD